MSIHSSCLVALCAFMLMLGRTPPLCQVGGSAEALLH